MVSVAGMQNRHGPTNPAKAARVEAEGATPPGKSGQSVGHLAKAQIAARMEQGEELAPNALGKAAATIAKMTFEQRAALLAPAAEPAPAPDPTTEPDPTTGTETPATEPDSTPDTTIDAGSTTDTAETVTPPQPDPISDAAATILAQIIADAEEASQPA